MTTAQDNAIFQRILDLIQGKGTHIGQRLPGERRLAELYSSCRGSVREALKDLAARGYVEIRTRSGCYVKSKEGRPDWATASPSTTTRLAHILQALELVGPKIVTWAAQSKTKQDPTELNQITAGMGRAIVNQSPHRLLQQHLHFYVLAAELAGNSYLIMLMRELRLAAQNLTSEDLRLPEQDMDSFFARHVAMVNALFQQDGAAVSREAHASIAAFSALFSPACPAPPRQ